MVETLSASLHEYRQIFLFSHFASFELSVSPVKQLICLEFLIESFPLPVLFNLSDVHLIDDSALLSQKQEQQETESAEVENDQVIF